MLMSYRFRSDRFSFSLDEWEYTVVFKDKGPQFHNEKMEPVPAPGPNIIKRLKAMLPHYDWNVAS